MNKPITHKKKQPIFTLAEDASSSFFRCLGKKSREANKGQSDRRRRWVASVASTELKINNVRKKRDKPPPKLVPEPPKLPCDGFSLSFFFISDFESHLLKSNRSFRVL